jgi:hypothetical protein
MIIQETPNEKKVIRTPNLFQILSQVEHVEETSVELVKGVVN